MGKILYSDPPPQKKKKTTTKKHQRILPILPYDGCTSNQQQCGLWRLAGDWLLDYILYTVLLTKR